LSAIVQTDAAIVAAVHKAWLQALDTERCDFRQSWEESGGDSVATLHLLLRIERALGIKLTFDLLRPEMRADDLVALLVNGSPAPPESQSLVHLVPGLFGDEPRLAKFRQALAGRISFNVVAIPDLRQPAAILGDMSRMGWLAARDIQARQPTGPLMLAGYSFGGCVAFETAQALVAAGREIALLAILDAPFGRAADGSTRTMRQRLGPTTIKFALGRWICSWDTGRKLWLSLVSRFGLSAEIASKRFIYEAFRGHARNRWLPAMLDVNTWLAVSAQLAPKTLSIWQRLSPRLRVVKVPGAHLKIFDAPAAEVLMPAFEHAVRSTLASMRSALGSGEIL
jgi:thioesterase domain-containing protein/acyl carrier protein